MMTSGRRDIAAAAVSLAVATLMASCAPSDPVPPPSTTTSAPVPTVTPSPSTTPSTPSPGERDKKDAESAVVRFWRLIDRLAADPQSKLEELTTVSRGSVAAQWRQNIRDYRFERVKQTGNVVVIDPSAKKSAEAGLHDVNACVDVSGTNLIDRNGKSVVAASRPPRVRYRYTVQKDAEKWYVITEKATGTC